MQLKKEHSLILKRLLISGTWLLIVLGIAVRLAIYFQNRNLFIDEANIARNIYERSFLELATPLSYEQYAPPIFLWALKLFTSILGYSEYVFRIYPLLAGIGTLIVMYYLLREVISWRAIWYPIGMLAVAYIMIRYSSELKQYMSDALIVLSLMLLALKTDILKGSITRFLLIWFVAGSIGIWGAMPSVFALAGVGCYYFFEATKARRYDKMLLVLGVGVLWLIQFAIYYFFILKPQIESNYLQNFHQEYFLFATPENTEEWNHNIALLKNLLQEAAGFNYYGTAFNTVLLFIGAIFLLVKKTGKSLLFLVPLAAVFLAAALNQYSLIPRVAIFIMPLFLILIGYGLDQLMRVKFIIVPIIALGLGVKFIYNHNMVKLMFEPLETEQVTDAMNFVMKQNIVSHQLYLHNGARPAFIYYTQIHPDNTQWNQIRDAHLLSWDASYEAIATDAQGKISVIFTSVYGEDLAATRATIEKHMQEIAWREKPGSYAYIYSK